MKKYLFILFIKIKNVRTFLVLLACFLGTNIYSQEAPKFNVKFKLAIHGGDLKNSLITITKNGKPYKVIDPNGDKYSVDLDLEAEYLFTCTKMGFITKSVIVDTHVPSGRETEPFAKYLSTVELNKQPEEQIVTYTQPVGRIMYTMEKGDFDYDKDYTQSALEMQKKAEEHPIAAPKPPTPNPRPVPPPPTPPKPVEPSNPIPIAVEKKPEEHYKEKPKPKVVEPVVPERPIVRNITEQIIQEDRRKITIRNVAANELNYTYKKEEYNWGGTYFYKNGIFVSQSTFEKETED